MTGETQVAIIGCGPVGAMLANLLGLQGISVVVLEREPAIFSLPRAVHMDDEIMRLLQTIGLAEAMTPLVNLSVGMKFVDAEGRLLLDWPRPQQLGPQGWHSSYRFHQPELEQVLRTGLGRFPHVALQLGAEVTALELETEAVTVCYEDLCSGQQHRLRARYVVGCDGARSLVRRMIGAPMQDLGFHERWLVVDGLLRRPRPDLGNYSVQYCDPIRPATYVRGTGNRRRWELSVLAHEDSTAVAEPINVLKLLEPWVSPDDITLERAVVYTFHAAIAQRWRNGRLLIAGDAAHLTPPFLGQGLCAGMRDVANLGWKLGHVLNGRNTEALLDTYQTERVPHVREYIELAVRLGGLINTKAMHAVVGESVLNGQDIARMTSIRPRLGPGLGGEAEPRGRVAPQPVLSSGVRLDDHVGYHYAVIAKDAGAVATDNAAVVSDPACDAWLNELGVAAVLVRPDRIIQGTAHNAAELQALLETIQHGGHHD